MHARQVSEREAPVLYKIVRELSAKAGKPMPRIYIAPTMSPNAFATGVVVDKAGFIVTNFHAVKGEGEIWVTTTAAKAAIGVVLHDGHRVVVEGAGLLSQVR